MITAIFGAQGYALGTFEALNILFTEQQIECFLVSSLKGNAYILGGLPVIEIDSFSKSLSDDEKKERLIYIAVPENIHDEIINILESHGFNNYIRVDSDKWSELMEGYFEKKGNLVPLSILPTGEKKAEIHSYMAKFYKDQILKSSFTLPEYVNPLQVGSSLTDVRVAELTDNTDDNISNKNPNYCELTGLYWIWKNKLSANSDNGYYGLCQYRRMFRLTDDDLTRMLQNDIDVILPYPLFYEPNIHAHHERYIKEQDWNALLKAIEELQPEYAEAFPMILDQKFLFNYNVILAKKSVLRDYCEWLFPILERTEELSVPKGSERADRYIGYMGETLETLYFLKNSDKLKIAHTGCKLFV